ncbi:MAG: hypothetical protein AMXMBFR53_09620 [Gemmatimonadota bacterium]
MWEHQISDPVLVVWERTDRGGAVYARWWRRKDGRRGYWAKKALGIPLRDSTTGLVDPNLEREILRRASALHRDLIAGTLDPRPADRLTVAAGVDRFLAIGPGANAVRTRRYDDLRRAGRVIEEHLGSSTPWSALGLDTGPRLWRSLAEQVRRKGDGSGLAGTEFTVGALFQIADWLRGRGLISAAACPRPPRWKEALRQDWRQITCNARPPLRGSGADRYSVDELRRLLVHARRVDPRLDLALALGLEGRLGQVIAGVHRRDLDLSNSGAWGHGRVRIPGNGGKHGTIIDLDAPLRERVERELADGYLRALETAHQLGQLADYPLMPAGGLVRGLIPAPLRSARVRAWSKASLSRAWRQLELLAGVPHVRGRGWRGVRKALADLAWELGTSARTPAGGRIMVDGQVLDELGGWARGSATRERVYRARQDAHVQRAVADLRRAVRGHLNAGQ